MFPRSRNQSTETHRTRRSHRSRSRDRDRHERKRERDEPSDRRRRSRSRDRRDRDRSRERTRRDRDYDRERGGERKRDSDRHRDEKDYDGRRRERDHDREPLTRATRRQSDPLREPGIDWVISLQERAILPPILPSLHYGSHTGWSRAAYLGNIEHFDYKEFSNLVDEIWLSNRSFLHRFWYDNLLATRKELIPQLELPFEQG